MNTAIVILNYRAKSFGDAIFEKLKSANLDATILKASTHPDFDINIVGTNIAQAKNKIIDATIDKYDYLFIVEDDMNILDTSLFEKYIEGSNTYKLGFMMHSYSGENNLIFKKPNPRLIFEDGGTPVLQVVAMPASGITLHNFKLNREKYDESYTYFELKEYVKRLTNKGIIPFIGLFIDIPNSYSLARRLDNVKMARHLDPVKIVREQSEKQIEWNIENDARKIVEYIGNCWKASGEF